MRPESSCLAYSSLDLIDNEIDTELRCDILQTLGELSRNLVVTTLAHNWLNNYRAYLRIFLSAPLGNLGTNISQ